MVAGRRGLKGFVEEEVGLAGWDRSHDVLVWVPGVVYGGSRSHIRGV